MKTIFRSSRQIGSLLLLLILLAAAGSSSPAYASLRGERLADTLPATTCTLVGGVRTCELWAKTGMLALPGAATVPIWGYTDSAAGTAQLPGPTLIVNEGETLQVILHNTLTFTTSLAFRGQELPPDLTGVAPGGTGVYTFDAQDAGTYLYEAGFAQGVDGARQVAMGLFGVLIVRPTTAGQAYDDPLSAYDDEALLVFSEIDPAFNANPLGFALQRFHPTYFLINGQPYPHTGLIPTSPGSRVLLRLVNAGLIHRSVGVLGMHQIVLSTDGHPFPYSYQAVAETVAAGQTIDTIAIVPASAALGSRFALYEAGLHLDNAGALVAPNGPVAFGGMLTFLTIAGTPPFPDGPLANNAQVSPNPTRGMTGAVLSATLSDVTTGGQDVVAAEYFVDALGAAGSGTPMSGAFGAPTVAVQAIVPAPLLTALSNGRHTLYVRGRDADGNWGAVSSVVLTIDRLGPATINLFLSSTPTNGTVDVTIYATGDDSTSGNSHVVAAQYRIDGGAAQPMVLDATNQPMTAMHLILPAASVAALSEGDHTISVRSQDMLGNWGPWASTTLRLDKTGPAASAMTLAPNPLDLSGAPPVSSVHLEATLTDPLSGGVNTNIVAAEGFVDVVGANGSGFPLLAQDGVFNSPVEGAYFNISIATFYALPQGVHTVYVHGRDAAGNWGATGAVTITVDKGIVDTAGPTITILNATPNPTGGAPQVTLNGRAADPNAYSAVVQAEWFRGADPGAGNGTPMAAADGAFNNTTENLTAKLNVASWGLGTHSISVRARDGAGNWGPVATLTLTIDKVRAYLPLVARP